ncbi:hypothetical protein DdX_06749 [Ditylenchus destructor]|uniref:Uncharacterized protein n=1 Tax=Ditylenchus destructor TaxID=166010 RepID=A0AAD4R927_9BILA|nr:hypothetical protein DdX_06749 [Ditylenchus destructor]
MWVHKKKTFLLPRLINDENEPIVEANSGKKHRRQKNPVKFADDILLDCLKFVSWKCINKCQQIDRNWFRLIYREKSRENDKSALPPALLEKFEMSKPDHYYTVHQELKELQDQEMHCVKRCESMIAARMPPTFSGRSEIYNVTNRAQEIHLGISVSKDRDIAIHEYDKKYERIFSWMFDNEIGSPFWAHIQHWFSHLLEPHGVIKSVKLVPFDLKILKDLKKSNSNLVNKIFAEELHIDFEFHEFDWVTNFCSKYCSAMTLGWTFDSINKEKWDSDEESLKECVDTIRGFIGSQGHNFDKIEIVACWLGHIDKLATEIVQMFKNHEDPSKMIQEISLERIVDEPDADSYVKRIKERFPFCLDGTEADIYKRTYKNQNSDYTLETTQSADDILRTIYFTIMKPITQ